MAVTYVKDFTFPSDFGFHKNGSASVPGKAKGGSTTPQRYREGGKIQGPQAKYAGHTKGMPNIAKQGLGASNVKFASSSDKGPSKTTGEKTSGLQAPAFKHGGKSERNAAIHKAHMARKARGGSIDVAEGKVKDGEKTPWNKDDGVSPGSSKRTPPGQGEKNSSAAKAKFATEGRNTEPATKQTGDVERMSEFSDFKKGGKVHKKADGGHIDKFERPEMHRDRKRNMGENPQAGGKDTKKSSTPYDFKSGGHAKGCGCKMCGGGVAKHAKGGMAGGGDRGENTSGSGAGRVETSTQSGTQKRGIGSPPEYKGGGRIKNLGHYAHGGKVRAGEKQGTHQKYEKAAGTPKKSTGDTAGSKGERSSGKATGKSTTQAAGTLKHHGSGKEKTMAAGGLSRGTNPKRNAAIHAKSHKPHIGAGALAAVAGLLGGQGAPNQGPGPGTGMGPPPGMAPGMGSPPGSPMGAIHPQGPSMGAPAMSHGGGVKHVFVHHVSHGKA